MVLNTPYYLPPRDKCCWSKRWLNWSLALLDTARVISEMRVEKRERSERCPSKEELIIRTSGSGDLLIRSLPSINNHAVDSWKRGD